MKCKVTYMFRKHNMEAEKWESALAVISKATPQDFETLCNLIADNICRDGALDPGKFMSFWTLEEWWLVQSALTSIMRKAVGKNWSNEKLCEVLGSVGDSYKKIICDVIIVHRSSLRQKLVQESTALSHSVLADFDWKLKLSLASDKLASLQEPLLQLDLDVRENNGASRSLTVELDRNELSKLVASLENCSKSVQQLTTSA